MSSERYAAAYEYAARKHEGQYRIGGEPYITHPAAVAEILRSKGYDEDHQITALFHDLLEDTDADEREIEAIGGKAVLNAVKLLTKRKGYVMSEYVAGIKSDPMAFAVKGADRLHNLQSAFSADENFRRQYVAETLEWYMDLMPEIPEAVKKLNDTLTDNGY
ncbi:MAG: HD domain-containing protein [Oscillospiraceae bacterium]